MTPAPNTLVKLILDSKALTIWNRKTGPVFWWTSGLPAPFYLRTEVMIGRELADDLLESISTIVEQTSDPAARANQLKTTVSAAYAQQPDYQSVIKAMVAHARQEFPTGSFTAISGGERRDWFFSIPFAAEIGLKHLYLFKNQTIYCDTALQKDEKVLHVSDIISKAASYFNLWLPTLKQANLICAGTVSVNAHGTAGTARLEEAGYKVAPVNRIDLSFFQQSHAKGLIDDATMEEITLYFASEKDWGDRYVMDNTALQDVSNTDKKTLERMRSFFTQDPWGLRDKHQKFFVTMLTAIEARLAA